ncbi:MAG: cation transporter [Ruminococcaceae bacterium]|nr:cation transporter [Oscillospiraceae bacterium]
MTNLLVRLFVKNNNDIKNPMVRNAYGTLGGVVGIICNLLLCSAKIAVGLLAGSISIIADGFNNLTDMGSSVITMLGFRLAAKPADRDHPYGHGRIEYMSAFIVAALIILVGIELMKESVTALTGNAANPIYDTVTIIILAVSVLIKFWLFLFNRKLGKKIDSGSLKATAQDSVNDALTTTAVLVSVIISKIFVLPFNLDAVIGIAVAVFIILSGFNSAKETMGSILGGPPDEKLVEDIKHYILSFEDFLGVHDLIVHNYGPGRQFASVHVEVPHNVDIVACHERIDICEKLVFEKFGIELVIHMDPVETDNAQINEAKQVIITQLTAIDPSLTLHDFRMTPKSKNRTNFIFDVVLPSGCSLTEDYIKAEIDAAAKRINKGYYCVITFDKDYTGK